MNKKLLIFGLPILALALVSGALIVYWGQVQVDVNVKEALTVSSVPVSFTGYPGDEVTENITITNLASVDLNVKFDFVETSNEALFSLDNSGEGVGANCGGYPTEGWQDKCEKRIIIDEPMALSALNTISWDANVKAGYLPHVDVVLSNGETLVFEYAKVDAPCDDTPYPTEILNTFGVKGIVDADAKAWLSSGVPGYCGLSEFDNNHKSLADWKVKYPNANILRIELEVDNWISASNSDVWNIVINGEEIKVIYTYTPKTISVEPGIHDVPVTFTIDGSSPVGKFTGNLNIARV